MAWWRRTRSGVPAQAPSRSATNAAVAHLVEFVASRQGIEVFIEPRTMVTPVTILLVAHDGEWTRRPVPSEEWAKKFAKEHDLPSYEAGVVGIPQRMRDYNRRQKDLQIPDGL